MHYSEGHSERNAENALQMCLWFILQELVSTSQIFLLPVNIKENGKTATDSKITAVHGCRTCHCLSNLQTLHSSTNEFCLSLGFLSAGNKHTKGRRTSASLLFDLEPVVSPVCTNSSQPWDAGEVVLPVIFALLFPNIQIIADPALSRRFLLRDLLKSPPAWTLLWSYD